MTIKDDKAKLIARILENKVYMLDSRMLQSVWKSLDTLSCSALQNLLLIIQNK